MPRRAQPGLLLLMAAAVAVAAVAPGAPCAAPAAACALPCAPNIAPKQCLHFLQESHKDELCGRDLSPGRRRAALANLRLRHCCEHRVAEALPEAAFHDTKTCRLLLQDLLDTDNLASEASCSHVDILLRYDCAQNYSIAFNCEHCKVHFGPPDYKAEPFVTYYKVQSLIELINQRFNQTDIVHFGPPDYKAEPFVTYYKVQSLIELINQRFNQTDIVHFGPPDYKAEPFVTYYKVQSLIELINQRFNQTDIVAYRRWICSALVPFYRSGDERIPPCLHLCQDVEQQCPYLLPDQTLTPSEAAHPTPQYAGEPNFLCLDPNIPRLEERGNSTTGDEDCCYTHCGAPGRGLSDVYVCERCPGRPPNNTRGYTTTDASRRRSTVDDTSTSGTRTSISPVSRWMWWTILLLTLRVCARFNDLLNCLISTVNSVRTVPECC